MSWYMDGHVQAALIGSSLNDKSAEKHCGPVSSMPKAPPPANIYFN